MANNIPNLQFNTQQQNPLQSFSAMPQYQHPIFMQPIGSIYGLNSSSDVGNIPMGSGVSVGLCLSEGIMYLKSMQNNGPVILGYKLKPLETQNQASAPSNQREDIKGILEQLNNKIAAIEKKVEMFQTKNGGKTEWQI